MQSYIAPTCFGITYAILREPYTKISNLVKCIRLKKQFILYRSISAASVDHAGFMSCD